MFLYSKSILLAKLSTGCTALYCLYLQVEEMNKMVSELAVVVTKESSMQEKCEDLLASTAIMQVTKIIQMI